MKFTAKLLRIPTTTAVALAGLTKAVDNLKLVVEQNEVEGQRQTDLASAALDAKDAAFSEADKAAKIMRKLDALLS